ncbi:MAG: hypothetical protein AB1724_07210 [Thermodesulfobacteriota bacterium]
MRTLSFVFSHKLPVVKKRVKAGSPTSFPENKSGKGSFGAGILLLAVSVLTIYVAYNIATEDRIVPQTPSVSRADKIDSRLSEFMDEKIDPVLKDNHNRNLDAVKRAVQDVNDLFSQYEQGVAPFVDDVTSWGTRFGIIGRYAGEKYDTWWKDKESTTRVADYISEKFGKHVFAGNKIEGDLQLIVNNFLQDVEANQNLMLSEITEQIEMSGLPIDKNLFKPENFTPKFKQDLEPVLKEMAKDSMNVGLLSILGGFILEESATKIVQSVLAAVSSGIAATTASSAASSAVSTGVIQGGNMLSISAAGGGAGSFGGPAGMIIGAVVGLTVGVIIDWWATEKLQEKLTDQCVSFLNNTKTAILSSEEGLIPSLYQSLSITGESYRRVINANLRKE